MNKNPNSRLFCIVSSCGPSASPEPLSLALPRDLQSVWLHQEASGWHVAASQGRE